METLPACVSECGPLFDVNGACVPPAAPTAAPETYASCFCNDPRLAGFKTGITGVCDNACTVNPADLGAIQRWFTSFCVNAGNTAPTATSRPGAGADDGGGGTWYGRLAPFFFYFFFPPRCTRRRYSPSLFYLFLCSLPRRVLTGPRFAGSTTTISG